MSHQLYDNIPIGRSEMRILQLQPGRPEDRIACRLFTKPIPTEKIRLGGPGQPSTHKRSDYDALSYAWGNPTPRHEIQCNGTPWHIAENLHSALLNLRQSKILLNLWVDAICLNQSDVSERNLQLPNIGSIYREAHDVMIWLGDPLPSSERAFRFINGTGRRLSHDIIQHSRMRNDRSLMEDEWSLLELYKRPWFKRIWVRQEVSQRRDPVILCGRYRASWLDLAALFKDMEKRHATLLPEVDALYRSLRSLIDRQINPKLLELLIANREAEATIPHDKIYALIGMAGDDHVRSVEGQYEKPFSEVYESFVKFLINRDGLLDVMYAAESPEYDHIVAQNLPSWVPDWRVRSSASDLLQSRRGRVFETVSRSEYLRATYEEQLATDVMISTREVRRRGSLHLRRPLNEKYKACWTRMVAHTEQNKSRALSQYRQETGILRVQGYEEDRIIEVLHAVDSTEQISFSAQRFHQFWERLYRAWESKTPRDTIAEGTMLTDTNFTTFWDATIATLSAFHEWKVDVEPEPYETLVQNRVAQHSDFGLILPDLIERLKNRKICISAKGNLCIVPFSTEINDTIFILHGGQLPCVLREVTLYSSRASALPGASSQPSISVTNEFLRPGETGGIIQARHFQFLGGCFVAAWDHEETLDMYLEAGVKPENLLLV